MLSLRWNDLSFKCLKDENNNFKSLPNNDLQQKLEEIPADYFSNAKPLARGIPTDQFLSENLNISPSYLSDILRSLAGQNAQTNK